MPTLPVSYSRTDSFPTDEFSLFENVPVFAEHETTARDGRKLRFTRDELQAVVDRCNRRITETGDYATVTVGHTPDPADVAQGKAQQPPVIGYAGPFKLGLLGQGDKQRYAILADFHIHNEDVDQMRRNPRRSPELWLEDDYKDMFLDPIALLGAQAPRLDMGLLYSASRNGKTVERYAAVAPGVGNVSLPSDDCLKEKMAKDASGHEHDKTGKFTGKTGDRVTAQVPSAGGMLRKVKGHITSVHPMQVGIHTDDGHHHYVHPSKVSHDKEKMARDSRQLFQRYSLNNFISTLRSSAMALSQDDIKQLLDAMEQLDWVQWCKSQMAGAAPEPDADDLGGAPPPPAADSGTPEKFGKDDDDADDDDEDAEKFAKLPADQNAMMWGKVPKSARADKGRGEYNADKMEGSWDEYSKESYQRQMTEKYDRLNGQVAALAKANEKLSDQLAKERNLRVTAERYQRLDKARQTRVFDLDDEVKKCAPERMTDEQFKDRVDFIEKYGKEVVADREPPVPEDEGVTIGAHAPGDGQRTERYSKAQRDSAFDRAKARALKGETGNLYEEELAKGK